MKGRCKMLRILVLGLILWLPVQALSGEQASICKDDQLGMLLESEILKLIETLPSDLIDRVQAGQATDDDLQVLANLGKRKSGILNTCKEEKLTLELILSYLINNKIAIIDKQQNI